MTPRNLTLLALVVIVVWHLAARANLTPRGCPFLRAIGLRPALPAKCPVAHS